MKNNRSRLIRKHKYKENDLTTINKLIRNLNNFNLDCKSINSIHYTKTLLSNYTRAYYSGNDNVDKEEFFSSFDTDSKPILVDTGASFSFSPCRDDFINYTVCNSEVSGLGTMKIIGKGTIHWPIVTDDGKTITHTIHNCYHVPAIPVRLFSPQTFCRQYSTSANAHLYVNADYSSLSWLGHSKRIQ